MWLTLVMVLAGGCLLAVFIGLARSNYERHRLTTEHYSLGETDTQHQRVVFLTDVHDFLQTDGAKGLADAVLREKPDLIVFGGDMFTFRRGCETKPDLKPLLELIRVLSEKAVLVYAEGNHEAKLKEKHPEFFDAFRQDVAAAGGRYLDRGPFLYNGMAIFSISLDLTYYKKLIPGIRGRVEPAPDLFTKKLGRPEKGMKNVLLMHHPMYFREAADWGADLVLAGHFHGGTIRLPLIGGLMTPQFQFLVKECAGLHRIRCTDGREAQMIVSRGIGTHSINIRINDLPEISVIEL